MIWKSIALFVRSLAQGAKAEIKLRIAMPRPLWYAAFLGSALFCQSEPVKTLPALEKEFDTRIKPLVKELCLACHSTKKQKGDLDLERFATLQDVLKHPKPWEGVVEQIELGEMPPKDKPQFSAEQRAELLEWVTGTLDAAAQARAGDPGPVVLRRLNNAEYTFTIRDLTGVDSLDPAKEFPADSAAGEGFMNTGNSLVMSPSMLTKFLDAGKSIASHAVLVPDGFRFSAKTTPRDWTDELLGEIRDFYRVYTDPEGGDTLNLQGVVFNPNEGGRLPIEKYLRATLTERPALSKGGDAFEKVAKAKGLSPKYLQTLWNALNGTEPSLLLENLRALWREKQPDEKALLAEILQWQKALWKFGSVGHIGKAGGPKSWMEPVSPIAASQQIRLKLSPAGNEKEAVIYLAAGDAGDGNANDYVLWKRPRITFPGRPDLRLKDARAFIAMSEARREKIFSSTAMALSAVAEAGQSGAEWDMGAIAAKRQVAVENIAPWFRYFGIGIQAPLSLDYFTNKLTSAAGYDFVQGWGSTATPFLLANSSDQEVKVPGTMKPRSVAVHPSPTRSAAAGWRSPISGTVTALGSVTHVHPDCGNGVEWSLELRRGKTRQRLAAGTAQASQAGKITPIQNIAILNGDFLSLIVSPRDGNHGCDLTVIELSINEPAKKFAWDLAKEISGRVLASNPQPDVLGNAQVWHFYSEDVASGASGPLIPSGSLLAKWQSLPAGPEKDKAAMEVQTFLVSGGQNAQNPGDSALYKELSALGGPLFSSTSPEELENAVPLSTNSKWSLDAAAFGKIQGNGTIDPADISVRAPSVLEIRLPAELLAGAEFAVEGVLAPGLGNEGSVQLAASTNKLSQGPGLIASRTIVSAKAGMWTSDNRQIDYAAPFIANEGSAARKKTETDLEQFRQLFPAALCYVKIVPVDEVVTLTLFHREDNHLARLMLSDAENARLNRLWDELRYVSRDAITLVDVFEQIWQYATQDADPKVFEPMRKPINDAAAALRQRLVETEPKHIEALLKFAKKAYRRPLQSDESEQLRLLNADLRKREIPHEDAFRLLLARVFTGPAFLYRLESAFPGNDSGAVTSHELATRLSYFLWASTPDQELLDAADAGKLTDPDFLVAQGRRMLKDPKVRRLATEFACAWLHIHDFESLNEKSDRHFPTFANLRGAMYEESIRFFTEIFQRNGSVLEIFDANHTFLNEEMAKHYGIPGVTGPGWRRVDGVKKFGRGGILGLSATLAKQSGASRTSPILRGNWVSEALLGEKLPRPPKGVPQLPEDEATETLTVRQLTEKHSSDPKCIGCHKRIDGYGFSLESFDAIGRLRTMDLGGREIDTRASLFDGTIVQGADELRNYLTHQKQEVVLRQFCRKLLGYSLGRRYVLSDKPLLAEMQTQLKSHHYEFGAAVETILRSRQFREIRSIKMASED